ncbi:hypothetical protein QOZ80_1BG0079580 [Eleusine coracana subsp. coracana]|nr:hypothetical protein QOZ80_1BG0079580 [Eleusine coracana subsp. coracana]
MDAHAANNNKRQAVADDDPLALTLGSIYTAAPTPPPPPPSRSTRRRRLNNNRAVATATKPLDAANNAARPAPPFPWATDRPARHDTLDTLLRRGVTTVEGGARCKRCGARTTVAYDLASRFRELRAFVDANRHAMDDRAPDAWMCPALPDCGACGRRGAVWPEIPADKRDINWLFLLLGQTLGCCTLEQLKYFCMNTGRHRTGAKNRVLYYAYIELCNQLQPFGDGNDARGG